MKQKQLFVSIIAGLLCAACGSDEDSETPTPVAPVYTGSETEATIDSTDKAKSIVREMFGLGGVVVSPTADETADPKPEPYNTLVPLALTETIEWINTENAIDSATAEKNLNVVSYCEEDQGVFDYNITIDDLTGFFSGSMNYKDCMVSGFTLAGSAAVTGNFDLVNNTILEINLDFLWLRADSETITYEAAGEISVGFSDLSTATTKITTATTTLQDYAVTINDSPVVKFEDYAITVTDDELTRTLTLSGIFYHPTHGFVTVSTDGVLEFTDDDVWPYQGRLIMDGDTSSLMIDCWDNIQYTLWLDKDGDGQYEGSIVSWL